MNILALDLSSKATGYCTWINDEMISGVLNESSTDNRKRISNMKNRVLQLIKDYNIEKVILEEVIPDSNRNSHTYKILTWLQGVIIIAIYEYNSKIEVETIAANSWRSRIGIHTGRGVKRAELKEASIKYVRDKYGKNVLDDEADSICLWEAYSKKELASNEQGFLGTSW